jgi:hypothetical protein
MKIRFILLVVGALLVNACSTFSYDSGNSRNANVAHNDCMNSASTHRITAANYHLYMQKCMDTQRDRPPSH